ncbi:MAG: helix-turn-helix domain-containing protein [Rubricoccaceae bacterium]
MSLRWMSAVFDAPEPQGTDRLMLLALADNANDEGVCWPGVETLQRKCGLGTRRAAEKALRRVEEWSERAPAGCVRLRVEERAGRSSVYHLELSGDPPAAVLTPEPGDGPEPRDGGEQQDGGYPRTTGRTRPRTRGRGRSERQDGGTIREPSFEPAAACIARARPCASARGRAATSRRRGGCCCCFPQRG